MVVFRCVDDIPEKNLNASVTFGDPTDANNLWGQAFEAGKTYDCTYVDIHGKPGSKYPPEKCSTQFKLTIQSVSSRYVSPKEHAHSKDYPGWVPAQPKGKPNVPSAKPQITGVMHHPVHSWSCTGIPNPFSHWTNQVVPIAGTWSAVGGNVHLEFVADHKSVGSHAKGSTGYSKHVLLTGQDSKKGFEVKRSSSQAATMPVKGTPKAVLFSMAHLEHKAMELNLEADVFNVAKKLALEAKKKKAKKK